MPFVPVNSTCSVSWRYTVDGQRVENTVYVENELGSTPSLNAVAAIAQDFWDNYRLILTNAVTLREIYVVNLENSTAPVLSVPFVPAESGVNVAVGNALPNNVTLAISFRTPSRGRSFRGRNYVPSLAEGQVNNNTVDSATVDAIVDCYETFSSQISAAGWQWVTVSRISNGVPRAVGVTAPVTSVLAVDLTVDSMRRRLPGRGL